HVLGHCDFFKNNVRFSKTSRDMVESMSASAERIRQYEIDFGKDKVEIFLDAVLAVQEHVDPSLLRDSIQSPFTAMKEPYKSTTPYDDLWNMEIDDSGKGEESSVKKFPEQPVKDLLQFIEYHNKYLTDWQRDILSLMRGEMLYFWPQLETKIMNEGWASYWHARIIRELELDEDETIEFAKLNASVVQPSKSSINPYYLGLKIFEDIERRWNNPTEEEQQMFGRRPGQGRKKIFEVREVESDSSFIRNYLTKKLVEDGDLYLFHRTGNDWTIVDKAWETVRDQLVSMRVNGGYPYIMVEDGDYLRNGELYLKHYFEGTELDVKYIEKTVPYVYQLWGRTVHLETVIEDRGAVFSFDGKKHYRKFL
ncbi:MAG: SpoVR family protein, partial [Bacilli bacterium]